VRLALGLHRFWFVRGHWQEGLGFVEKVLARVRLDAPTALHAKLLGSAAGLHNSLGALQTAQGLNEEALAILRALNDRQGIGNVLHNLGLMALMQGHLDRAQTLYTESMQIQRELNDTLGIADELHHLGLVAHERGDLMTAKANYEESLALRKPFGDLRGIAFTLQYLANIAFTQGQYQDADRIGEENLAIRVELGDRKGIADAHHNLGLFALGGGHRERAQSLLRQALALRYELNDWTGTAESLDSYASLFSETQDYLRAARLHQTSEAIRRKIGVSLTPYEQSLRAPLLAVLQENLSEQALAAVSKETAPESWEQTIKELISD
jgi:tetratricopeptide (TPR) repeat protein